MNGTLRETLRVERDRLVRERVAAVERAYGLTPRESCESTQAWASATSYANGCRCDPCRRAATDAKRNWRSRRRGERMTA